MAMHLVHVVDTTVVTANANDIDCALPRSFRCSQQLLLRVFTLLLLLALQKVYGFL